MKNKILLATLSLLLCSFAASSQLKLNSYPSATAVIYLDFDGEEVNSPVWNYGNTINCAAPAFNNTQVTEIFNRVAEDYRPFNINITTDVDVFNAAPLDRRIRVIITTTSSWFAGVGGVGYRNSFTWGDDTPCFVFCDRLGPNNAKMVAECCSHESGHTLGLSHQSTYDNSCNLTAAYNEGNGNGETAWAPIMGNSYYRNMSGWSNGPTPYGCSSNQDNLSILVSNNGFGYRADDYSDDISNAPAQINVSNINVDGIIATTNDKDAFKFSLAFNSNFHLGAKPYSIAADNSGANLDIKLSLYDGSKNLIQSYNPAGSMSVSVDTILNAGTYYMVVEGTGNSNTSDYGSLGSYNLTGMYGVLPVCNIKLQGNTANSLHNLTWSIDCNETISNLVLQSSNDAVNYTDVKNVTGRQAYSYMPLQQTNIFYRLQAISLSGRVVYSETVLLKKPASSSSFMVSAFVANEIKVLATGIFKFRLADEGGNILATGSGAAGANSIPLQNQPAGIYILQLFGCGETAAARVLKL